MLDESALVRFIRRDPLANSFAISEIADFKLHMGCSPAELLPLMLQDEKLHMHLSALISRLTAFPDEVATFINIRSLSLLVSGGILFQIYDSAS